MRKLKSCWRWWWNRGATRSFPPRQTDVCLSVSTSPSLPASLCLRLPVYCVNLCQSPPMSCCISLCIFSYDSLPLSISLSVWFSFSVCLSQPACVCMSIYVSHSVCLSLFVSFNVSVSIHGCLALGLCLYVCLSVCLPPSLSPSLSLPLSLSPSLSLYPSCFLSTSTYCLLVGVVYMREEPRCGATFRRVQRDAWEKVVQNTWQLRYSNCPLHLAQCLPQDWHCF